MQPVVKVSAVEVEAKLKTRKVGYMQPPARARAQARPVCVCVCGGGVFTGAGRFEATAFMAWEQTAVFRWGVTSVVVGRLAGKGRGVLSS